MVDYEQAIKKPFTDIVKLLIGIVLSMIPIIHWFAKGFILESSGLGKTRPSKKMPEWKNWRDLFIKGLLSDIIFLIYAIPAIVIFLIGVGYAAASLIETYFGTVLGQNIAQNWVLAIPSLIAAAPIILLGFILMLIAIYLIPIAILNYIKTKRFSAAFELNSVFKKAFTGKYFVVWLAAIIITAIITIILSFIPIIGPGIAFFITGVIAYSLYGQIYKEI